MRTFLAHRLRFLRGDAGMTLNATEGAVTTGIQGWMLALLGGAVVALVGGATVLSLSGASAAQADASRIQFERDVRAAAIVHGYGNDAVALLADQAGKCAITIWSASADGDTKSLRSSTTVVGGKCSTTTAVDRAGQGQLQADQLRESVLTYENLGRRTITFDTTGNPTLASGSKPESVSDQDWNDVRPYTVTLTITSAVKELTVGSRTRAFIGTTPITNLPAAGPDLRYVPPASEIPTPSDLRIASVVRSQTTGTSYSGAREGITVTLTGGICKAMPTTLTLTYTTSSPTGVAPVNVVTQRTLTGAASTIDLAGVPNASTGSVALTAACGVGSAIKDAAANYHQDLPAPTLTAVVGSTPEQHLLTWTAISSLPSSFRVSWSSDFGADDDEAPTSNLSTTMRFAPGYTYGGTFTYLVAATANGEGVQSNPAKVTQAWPAAPAAQAITYTRTGYSGNFVSGTVKWSYATNCPAGTTRQAQQLENRTGQSNGTISSTVNYTGPWTANLTTVSWSPSYATQAYAYGMGVNTRCVGSNSLASPITAAQSANWVTPWTTPATPVWDAYNYRDYIRGTNWTYSTCLTAGCASMTVDYKTYCPAGTWLSWSNWISQSWTGSRFSHPMGYQDNWQLPSGSNAAAVYYMAAEYTCASPWSAASPHSPQSGTVGVTVYR
jgi:hypothetical protein